MIQASIEILLPQLRDQDDNPARRGSSVAALYERRIYLATGGALYVTSVISTEACPERSRTGGEYGRAATPPDGLRVGITTWEKGRKRASVSGQRESNLLLLLFP